MNELDKSLDEKRSQWLAASKRATLLADQMFPPGCGYGDPDALREAEHELQSARDEAERLFREYHDLDRRYIQSEMLKLQRSQRLATWASFFVAAAVGVATIVNVIVQVLDQSALQF